MSKKDISRRNFLKVGSASVAAFGLGSLVGDGWFGLGNGIVAIPASEGYLIVDSKKCQGCNTCTMTCSLAHHGTINLSLGRIQIEQNPYKAWPDDLTIDQCHQCPTAPCVQVCPTGANHFDKDHGNVRVIDPKKCIGCQQCLEACPYETSRVVWNHIDRHSQKCDLCTNTPFWKEKGGIGGKQACVEVCPVSAIKFTKEIPTQFGSGGYDVNLRRQDAWKQFKWPVD